MVHFPKSEFKPTKKISIKRKHSCFIYGEAVKDRKFLQNLTDLKKFKFHTSNWIFNFGNASGGSSKELLEKCQKEVYGYSYDLILCVIDLDHLKNDYPKSWKEEKNKLEKYFLKIVIIWQIDNLEDEFKKVLGNEHKSKHRLNKVARERIKDFINSSYWKRILKPIKQKEKQFFSKIGD